MFETMFGMGFWLKTTNAGKKGTQSTEKSED